MSDDPRVLVLAELRKQTALLERIAAALSGSSTNAAPANGPSVDLDGPHGNPVVKAKDPRDWSGDNMRGRTFSECPPEYLDMLADRYDYFANKDGADEKDKRYARLDGARARGWAARLRAGWTPPASESATDDDGNYVTDGAPSW